MRTFIFLLCTTVFSFSAEKSFSQEQIIIDKDQYVSVDEVFNIIQNQTKYRFLYPQDLFVNAPKVKLTKGVIKLSKLLSESLSKNSVRYELSDNNTILLKKSPISAEKNTDLLVIQGVKISGTVTDAYGQALPGTNIIEKGTNNGTQSDFDGNFSLTVSSNNSILVASYLGFLTQEVNVGNQTKISIVLKEDSAKLDEVVVIGYGTRKKSDITGAVASVSSQDLEKAVFNTVDQLLQGRSSGVQVTSASGEPGATSSIRIRGNNSISGDNSPLYVVDGIPISGTPNFNPQEIENLEVLKDASATAIYGSRGANGVILITTKRGKSGVTSFDFYSNVSYSNIDNPYKVLNGRDYAEYRNISNAALGVTPLPFPNPEQYEGQGFDWFDEIVRTGVRQEYGLNISGGAENTRFFVSGNLLEDKGVILGSKFKRGSVPSQFGFGCVKGQTKL